MLGPFVDDTDGKTTEEALTLSQADLHLSKNGAASAQKNDATAATHRYGGNYMVDLDATDTNTLGHLRLMCKESGALPVIADFMVLPAEAYDTLVGGTDNFTVDLSTQAKADVNAEADTALTDYDPPTRAELTSDINSLNDPTAAAIADAVLDEALSGHVTAGTLGKAVADIEADTSELQSDDIPTTLATLATSSALATVDANVDAILVDTGTTIPAQITALNDLSAADVNAEVDTALSDIHLDHLFATDYDPAAKPGTATALLNELVENDAGVSRFTANALEEGPTGASASAIADAVWDEALSGHTTAGSAGKALADIETDATAILEDTATTIPALIAALNDLSEAQVNAQVDVAIADAALATAADLATVDGIVDAILVDTGTTIPALIAALENISAADVNAQVDIALADYDGPTKAELDAGLAALNDPTAASIADAVLDEALAGHVGVGSLGKAITDIEADTNELQSDDVPGLIGALNDVSTAQVNAEVDTAITDAALATAANLATVDAIVDAILVDTGTTIPALIAALNNITAAEVADAVLDEATAGHTTPGTVGALLIDVLADTNELQADDVPALIAALNDLSFADIMRTQVTEAYPTAGQTATLEGFINFMIQFFTEFDLVNTTYTVKELDKATTAAVLETDDANDPTSMTRTS